MCRYLVILIVLLSLGCSNDDLPTYIKLDGLRVLALVANNPNPDTSSSTAAVTITPYISDSRGGGRTLTYSAASCLDPGVGLGAVPTCENSISKVTIANQQTVTGLTGPNFTGSVTSTLSVTVPLQSIVLAGRTEEAQFNGVPYIVTFEVSATDGSKVKAFKRILVNSQGSKNSNPDITDILSNGASLNALPSEKVTLTPVFAGGSEESYESKDVSGSTSSLTERLTTTWFITDGDMDFFRTEGTENNFFTPPNPGPTDRNVMVIGVTRDGRGGIDILDRTL